MITKFRRKSPSQTHSSNYWKNETYRKYLTLPIKDNAILFEAGQGKNLNGNMFALLYEQATNSRWEHLEPYFVVTEDNVRSAVSKFEFYGIHTNLILRESEEYMEALATCHYLFTDNSFPPYFAKREGQIYMNTWHGTPLKTLGRSDIQNAISLPNIQKNYLMSDYALFPNEYTRDVFMKDYMLENIYNGEVVLCDYPRNSVLLDSERAQKLRRKLGILDEQLIAYMPTWRGTSRTADVQKQIDILKPYLDDIDSRLNDNQIFYVNFHFLLSDAMDLSFYKHIRPFPKEYETYEFLALCDMLVTDYSSVFFDFACSNRRILLFAYDLDEYMAERGTYFPVSDLPFPIAYTVDELISYISDDSLDPDRNSFLSTYCAYSAIDCPTKILELVVNGNRSDICIENGANNGKGVLLAYCDSFKNEFLARKELQDINNLIKESSFNVIPCFIGRWNDETINFVTRLPKEVNFLALPYSNDSTVTPHKRIRLSKKSSFMTSLFKNVVDTDMRRERDRIFPRITPNEVVYIGISWGNNIYRIFDTFDCTKRAIIQPDILTGTKNYKAEYLVMQRFFRDNYDTIEDQSNNDVRWLWDDAKESFYNSTISLSVKRIHYGKTETGSHFRALCILRRLYDVNLENFQVEIGEKRYPLTLSSPFSISKNRELVWVEFDIPEEDIYALDVYTQLHMIYTDESGYGCYGNIKSKFKTSSHVDFPDTNTSTLFGRAKGNNLRLTVKTINITDQKIERIKIHFARSLSHFCRKDIILLYEKDSARYEESASVVYEALIDLNYNNAFFILDRGYPYLETIKEKYRKNIVWRFSLKHYLYFFAARTFIGSETLAHAIEVRTSSKAALERLKDPRINYVFLQHGVMYMVSLDAESRSFFHARKSDAILRTVVSSKLEKAHFVDLGEYDPESLYICGLPKYDRNVHLDNAKRIVIMLTWRQWELSGVRMDFSNTQYYQFMERIFNSVPDELKNNVTILAHPLFYKLIRDEDFPLKQYMDFDSKFDTILQDTKLLITDYSSIAYDAFYRGANVIFCWEELQECMSHYGEHAHLMLNEGNVFGDICTDTAELSDLISLNYDRAQKLQHLQNYSKIVEFHDGKNTERLISLLKKDGLL